MRKTEFFRYCETSDLPPSVHVRREDLEDRVELWGCWHGSTVLIVTLLHPLRGRQWSHDKYQSSHRRCDEAVAKFNRWLDEWRRLNPETAARQQQRNDRGHDED